MWDGIELREVRVFLVLAEELHFGRTAERLRLTPSRVSQTLRSLERKLGGRLVHRTSRRVQLTGLGEQFRTDASQAHRQLLDAFERTHAATGRFERPLRLGLLTGPAGGPHLLDIVKGFEELYPQYPVMVSEVGLDVLHRGEVDVMASWLPHGQPDLVVGPTLAIEPRVLAVASDHPLARQPRISLEDIADYQVADLSDLPDELRETWIPSRSPSGRHISRLEIGLSWSAALTAIAYHIAAGKIVHPTVPSAAGFWAHYDLTYVPITDMPPFESALLWRRDSSSPALSAFTRIAPEILGSVKQAEEHQTTE